MVKIVPLFVSGLLQRPATPQRCLGSLPLRGFNATEPSDCLWLPFASSNGWLDGPDQSSVGSVASLRRLGLLEVLVCVAPVCVILASSCSCIWLRVAWYGVCDNVYNASLAQLHDTHARGKVRMQAQDAHTHKCRRFTRATRMLALTRWRASACTFRKPARPEAPLLLDFSDASRDQ